MSDPAAGRSWGDAAIIGAIAALIAVPWLPAIVRDSMPLFMDTVGHTFPLRRLAAEMLHAGIAPYWNPAVFGGAPLLANPQAGLLYPGHWPFLLWPSPGMFTATSVGHVICAAVGVFLLLRALGCGRAAGALGALATAWNGWTWAHFAFVSYHQAWAWWPWQWWALIVWLRGDGRGWPRAGAILGFLGAMQILAGAPQLVFYNAIACLMIVLAGLSEKSISAAPSIPSTSFPARIIRVAAGLALAAALALAWSAPQWIPARAFLAECVRQGALPPAEVAGGALTLDGIARALFGRAGFPEDAETTAFFGLVPLLLLAVRERNPRFPFAHKAFLAVFVAGLVLSWKPLAGLWMKTLPGFSHMHDPRRAMALVAAAVPILAALGLESLDVQARRLVDKTAFHRRFLAAGLIAAAGVALPVAYHLTSPDSFVGAVPPEPALGLIRLGSLPIFWMLALLEFAVVAAVAIRIASGKSLGWTKALFAVGAPAALFVFALARVDLKVTDPQTDFATLVRRGAERIESRAIAPANDETAGRPPRFFSFDPTGHYTYDYIRSDAWLWMLPGLSPLTWRTTADSSDDNETFQGLCDLQGYDPSLPRRWADLMRLTQTGHILLYPRHFALARAPRDPLVSRLAPDVAVGPVDRYVLPILPPLFAPGDERIVPLEEWLKSSRLAVQIRPLREDADDPPGHIEFDWLDGAGLRLDSASLRVRDTNFDKASSLPVSEKAAGMHAVRLRYAAPADAPSLVVLAAFELLERSARFQPLDAGSIANAEPSPVLFPSVWRYTQPTSYTLLTADVALVPPDEDADAIYWRLDKTVLEWPADAPMPRLSAEPAGKARLIAWTPGRVEIEADVQAAGGAALVVREPIFRGWTAQIDNARPVRHMPADIAFQSVWLEKGRHRVVFSYRPEGFRAGVAAAGLAAIATLVLLLKRRAKQSGQSGAT